MDLKKDRLLVALDFDGVLHSYTSPYGDGVPKDPPVPGALDLVAALRERGYRTVVFTARDNVQAVGLWLVEHGFPEMRVTNVKPKAALYVDDRALRFDGNPKTVLDFVDGDPGLSTWQRKPSRTITPEKAKAILEARKR
jgi:hypothetical protein